MDRIVEVEIEQRDGFVVAGIDGEVDISNIADVRRQLTDCVPNSALGLVVDLSGTRYLDSSGLHLLFEISNALDRRRQRIRVVAPEGTASERVLILTGLDKVVPVLDTVAQAMETIGDGYRATARARGSSSS
jgi:stage II sporulation protein AA (anti-sigma F factor antagonist)